MKRCKSRTRKSALAAAALAAAVTATAAVAAGATENDRTALRMALDDEYRAEATYKAVLDKFGDARPFVNIIQAERRHAAMAAAQMQRLGMEVPSNPYLGGVQAPATLLEACQTGVQAEVENIALYDKILPGVSDPQIRMTLEKLQAASRDRHLPAFQRCVARGGTMGGGGHGKGRGGGGMGGGGGGHGPGSW